MGRRSGARSKQERAFDAGRSAQASGNGSRTTLSELEQHLARAADMLRGPIDQADFKSYIFPLLFFKRISDVYLEEYAQALEESGGDIDFATFAENHRFQIPDGSHWDEVGSAPRTSARRSNTRCAR